MLKSMIVVCILAKKLYIEKQINPNSNTLKTIAATSLLGQQAAHQRNVAQYIEYTNCLDTSNHSA